MHSVRLALARRELAGVGTGQAIGSGSTGESREWEHEMVDTPERFR